MITPFTRKPQHPRSVSHPALLPHLCTPRTRQIWTAKIFCADCFHLYHIYTSLLKLAASWLKYLKRLMKRTCVHSSHCSLSPHISYESHVSVSHVGFVCEVCGKVCQCVAVHFYIFFSHFLCLTDTHNRAKSLVLFRHINVMNSRASHTGITKVLVTEVSQVFPL